ncbi:MAG: chromosome segregation protein SMC [Microbacteriaceae bacterium]
MYLKSLTLKGFKSFAQPTTFAFEPGVTCVVGPNGSGKSNVVDALAWVMGEQGAKTLRGGKMEDVIFAGTSTRGPLGRAQVILTIDNSDGALPIEYSEVTISRTLFRNGGSEYAINRQNCRLLDVQELLSDSGLGREMHVIVSQGHLDAVLHATPEERRGFIEEAAGILKHRRRKEKTLRKLDAMQANLTRLSDLAGEIRRQLKPLGHQAEIAREAQSIAAVVRDARIRLLADDVAGLRSAIEDHSHTENQSHSERIVVQEQLEQCQLRVHRLEQAQLGDAVDTARRTSFGLESVQERLRNLYTLANQRLALLGSQADSPGTAPILTSRALEESRIEVERMGEAVRAAELAWHDAQATTTTARTSLDAVDEEIAAQSALVSQHDLQVTRLAGKADVAASKLAAAEANVLRQRAAMDAATARRKSIAELSDAAESEASATQGGGEGLGRAYALAQQRVAEAEGEIERLREELHLHQRERDALAARAGALSQALDVRDGSSALLAARLNGIRGLVADNVRVEPGFEAAIAAALGGLADAVLADNRDSALQALIHARDDELGRVEIAVGSARAGDPRPVPAPDAQADRPGVVAATTVVAGPAGILSLLADTVIADDLDTAAAVWPQLNGQLDRPITIITKAGEVLTEQVLRGGSAATRSKLELVAGRDAAAARLHTTAGLIEQAEAALDQRRGELVEAKEHAKATLAAVREFDSRLAEHSEKRNRLTVQLEAVQAECRRLEAGLAASAALVDQARREAQSTAAETERARSAPRPILDVATRDELFAELERARDAELQARLALETARERLRAGQAHGEALARQREAERQAAEEASRRAAIRKRQVDAATEVIGSLPPVLDSVDRSVAAARLELASAEAERAGQSAQLNALRGEEAALRERLSSITENVHGLELQIYEKKLQLSGLLERAGSEFGLIEEVLVAEYGPQVAVQVPDEDGTGPYDRQQQQTRLAKAERKLAQLGRVNPLALEEFAALEQRHSFLTGQLADLTKTRADLISIIADIDEKMQTIFHDAFEDTRSAFAEVFPVLFPGGTGSIRLTDPSDLLGTGIDVSVKPAGKKIERLTLLSGGERSLAAVALLIAIFKARPSPFYIMDEVEAALDDANLGRLLSIFEDLRQASQLIVITHQKRTMEIADALYGVSMRQDGVSAVVGQRVRHEEAS